MLAGAVQGHHVKNHQRAAREDAEENDDHHWRTHDASSGKHPEGLNQAGALDERKNDASGGCDEGEPAETDAAGFAGENHDRRDQAEDADDHAEEKVDQDDSGRRAVLANQAENDENGDEVKRAENDVGDHPAFDETGQAIALIQLAVGRSALGLRRGVGILRAGRSGGRGRGEMGRGGAERSPVRKRFVPDSRGAVDRTGLGESAQFAVRDRAVLGASEFVVPVHRVDSISGGASRTGISALK